MAIIDLLLPKHCLGCGVEGVDLCKTCFSEIRPVGVLRCPFCEVIVEAGQTCQKHKNKALDGALNAGYYHDPVLRDALHLFKYSSSLEILGLLGNFLANAAEKYHTLLPKNAIVIPLPLLWFRQKKRGYNQAALLAEYTARSLGLSYKGEALKRRLTWRAVITNSPQAKMEKDDPGRWYVMKNAFRIQVPEAVRGRPVILVDDVLTSGSTLEWAAQALKAAGSTSVFALVLARG